jgi:hypothetical protein
LQAQTAPLGGWADAVHPVQTRPDAIEGNRPPTPPTPDRPPQVEPNSLSLQPFAPEHLTQSDSAGEPGIPASSSELKSIQRQTQPALPSSKSNESTPHPQAIHSPREHPITPSETFELATVQPHLDVASDVPTAQSEQSPTAITRTQPSVIPPTSTVPSTQHETAEHSAIASDRTSTEPPASAAEPPVIQRQSDPTQIVPPTIQHQSDRTSTEPSASTPASPTIQNAGDPTQIAPPALTSASPTIQHQSDRTSTEPPASTAEPSVVQRQNDPTQIAPPTIQHQGDRTLSEPSASTPASPTIQNERDRTQTAPPTLAPVPSTTQNEDDCALSEPSVSTSEPPVIQRQGDRTLNEPSALTSTPLTIQNAGDRTLNEPSASTSAFPTIQRQGDPIQIAPPAIQNQPAVEAAPNRQENHTSESSVSTSPPSATAIVQPDLESQSDASLTPSPQQNLQETGQHPEAQQAIAPPAISPLSPHHATLLRKPLGFTRTLVQPQTQAFSRSYSKSDLAQSESDLSSTDTTTLQRPELSNSALLKHQNDLEHPNNSETTPTIQASVDSTLISSQSQSLRVNAKALPSLQNRNELKNSAIAPLSNQTFTKNSPDQWSSLSELYEISQSENPSAYSPDTIDAINSDFFGLDELSEQLANVSSTSISSNSIELRSAHRTNPNSDSRSVSLHSPASTTQSNAPTLEQQLEILVYPVYSLMRQRWQMEQERQHHLNDGYPNWMSDTRLSKLERSRQTTYHPTLLESPNPNSPIHHKLQLLAQQVYELVQWQWANSDLL